MVAPTKTRRVVCTVIRVAERPEAIAAICNRLTTKPSALVPWADPYIAGLVRRLQSEVRMERAQFGQAGDGGRLATLERADLEPPSPAVDSDWDWWDGPRWTIDGEPAE